VQTPSSTVPQATWTFEIVWVQSTLDSRSWGLSGTAVTSIKQIVKWLSYHHWPLFRPHNLTLVNGDLSHLSFVGSHTHTENDRSAWIEYCTQCQDFGDCWTIDWGLAGHGL
jgi:hypothetical protein